MHDRGEMPTPDPGWLRHVAEGGHRPDAALPEPRKWETADLGEPPTRDGTDAGTDDDVLDAWLDDLVRFGLARLRGVGSDPDLVASIAARIGVVDGPVPSSTSVATAHR